MAVHVKYKPVEATFSLEGALQALYYETETVYIRADALCINQTDNLEKLHQVQVMTGIYKLEINVYVWLGYLSDPEEDF